MISVSEEAIAIKLLRVIELDMVECIILSICKMLSSAELLKPSVAR